LKKETRLAVFWGAIPGALPPLIGYFSSFESISINEISNNYIVMLIVPNLLFLSQFIWQFPHFWAIAWVFNSDYSSAGINLLPSKIKFISSQIMLLFTLTTILINFIPFLLGIGGYLYFTVSTIGGLLFLYVAYTHFIRQSDITAKKMMVISIIYLPILQLALLADISI
jgi:protoheme IX farnesyltransferase